MRAAVIQAHGGPEQLVYDANYPDPTPGEDDVIIAVKASSLNYHDIFTRRGMPGIKLTLPVVPGLDIAGEITELGSNVTGWSVGDRVLVDPVNRIKGGLMGETVDGGCAEYCRVPARQLVKMPDGVDYGEAAALPVAYGTAHRMMFANGHVKAGETVMVLGASGGVGTGCVLLAKHVGAEVISCASSDDKLARLTALGSDHVLDYTKHDIHKWVYEKYGKPFRRSYDGGIDVVVNFTGGDTWVPSLRALKRGGRILTCGATAGYDPTEDLRFVWTFELQILGSNSWLVEDLVALMDMIQRDEMHPVIDKRLPLEETAEGVRLIEEREVFGKVLIVP
ncbi:MAG: zinc-binding dehydrogenase [Acidimicrobiales bacterium]|nr:MAG: zinc-binding dehydrogenase [Acidimicrobiales bacterium]